MSFIPILKIYENIINTVLYKIITKLKVNTFEGLIKEINAIPQKNIKYMLRDYGIEKSDLKTKLNNTFTKD